MSKLEAALSHQGPHFLLGEHAIGDLADIEENALAPDPVLVATAQVKCAALRITEPVEPVSNACHRPPLNGHSRCQ